ncbi:hypothetical protein QLX67_13870 [Balneolaceae bacterium ANBcel3]|nr:hypothetical protein [Balneolaceae bacterium ANBcel3]
MKDYAESLEALEAKSAGMKKYIIPFQRVCKSETRIVIAWRLSFSVYSMDKLDTMTVTEWRLIARIIMAIEGRMSQKIPQ